MDRLRRHFLGQSAALFGLISGVSAMKHVILLGDSIFDNASYTGGKPALISQLRESLPPGWKASLLAVDGATTEGIPSQLAHLPDEATHLVLSVGGNNVLMQQRLLDTPVHSSARAFDMLATAAQEFESAYRHAVAVCMKSGLPLIICTIYNGNFPDKQYQRRASIALTAFNDAILRIGIENRLTIIDLRQICNRPEDYANPIEPSHIGGAKMAKVIVREVTAWQTRSHGAIIVGQ